MLGSVVDRPGSYYDPILLPPASYEHPRALTAAASTLRRQPIWLRLVYAGDTKIRRHIKIRKDANPFDPQWKPYFAERAFQKKFGIHRQQAGIKPS